MGAYSRLGRPIETVPTLHREGGFVFRFRASDGTEPPHVHVVGNGGRAKVWLTTLEMTDVRRYDVRQRGAIRRIAKEHLDEWRAAWNDFFGGQ